MNNTVKDKLIEFIQSNFLIDYDTDFQDETDLFREGLVDSFGYVELVKFLRSEFDLAITEADLVSDTLSSVENILQRLQTQAS